MPTSEELNELVRAVAATGNREAFAELFRYFAPRVKAYLMRSGGSKSLAEELTQETMVSVWRKARMFKAGKAGASTWIFTIARNLRVDHYRRRSGSRDDRESHDGNEMVDSAALPEEQLIANRRERELRNALSQLSVEQAHILRLSFYEDQPHSQIARDLDIPLGTVKSRVRLAVHHLRRLLDGFEA